MIDEYEWFMDRRDMRNRDIAKLADKAMVDRALRDGQSQKTTG
jgi:uncharacterized protein YozE (UPF0346 family)